MNARLLVLTLVLLLGAGAFGLAQMPEMKKELPGVPDPTHPGPIFEKILNQKNIKTATTVKLPSILLKGRIVPKGKLPAALLEVDGKLYLVRQQSILSAGSNLTLKIVELNATEIRIELSPLNEVIVLR